MHKVRAIIRREYSTRIRTLRFVLGTVLTPLLMATWIAAPNYFASKTKSDRDVIVLDQTSSQGLFETLSEQLRMVSQVSAARGGTRLDASFRLTRRPVLGNEDLAQIRDLYEQSPKSTRERALLIIPSNILDGGTPRYVGTTLSDPAIAQFEQVVRASVLRYKLSTAGLESGQVERAMQAQPMKIERMKASGLVSGDDAESVAIFMLVTMYTVTFMYGVWMMRGVAMEKRTRIAEVLLTIAKPVELMAGKLLGIGLVGLTQCLIWVLAAELLSIPGFPLWHYLGIELPHMNTQILGYFLAYFILGYFLYAVLFALAGASSTNTDDANYIQQPLIVLTVTPMLVFFVVLRDPDGMAATVLSLIPFFSPTLMILRLAVSEPPVWQVAASFAIMVATILICLWATAKVYRAGILMSGNRQSFAALIRWLRYA